MGKGATQFAGFLKDARQSWWQVFPLGPPGVSNSPYQVLSAFAGNPIFISLESFVEEGLLQKSDMAGFPPGSSDRARYDEAWIFKKPLLRKAFLSFERLKKSQHGAFESFCGKHAAWLDDYALYCALKGRHRGASWETWEKDLRRRHPAALKRAADFDHVQIRYHQFLQFKFFQQWKKLKVECNRNGIRLMGDIPIFVAHDSADVWANQDLFCLNSAGAPAAVAGVPPDYFSRTGQRWGNPLYRWEILKRTGYDWWVRRFKTLFELMDASRLDHFIGFHNYWSIPAAHKTAQRGRWVKAPGEDFFKTVFKKLGRLPLVAEDLGALTPAVTALREKFSLPGMRVLQFAFDGQGSNPFLPHNYTANSVVYTGTHDNDTTVGWFRRLKVADRKSVLSYLGAKGREIHWDLIRLALSSVANTAIFPMQDALGLDSRARMNVPGTALGNWTWRLQPQQLTKKISSRLASLTETYGRT